jgi:hypothetical protein
MRSREAEKSMQVWESALEIDLIPPQVVMDE